MAVELIGLDEAAAVAERVGAKAGRLADARRRRLPVLPGFAVLPGPGRALVAELLPQVAERGPHAVSLALMERVAGEVDLTPAIERARTVGTSLVARSSSIVEDDAVWSGAFSSFLDLRPDQLTTAVAGCWASTVTPSVLEICERTGIGPPEACPAVLVQPMVEPQAAGTATFTPTGVEIMAVWGSPAPLLAGWVEGWQATVRGDDVTGPAVGEGPPGRGRALDRPFPAGWFRAVADLASAALDGAPAAIEWAMVDDRPLLLQARPALLRACPVAVPAPHDEAAAPPVGPGGGRGVTGTAGEVGEVGEGAALLPGAVTIARAIARYGGPLGDELVLPWLLSLGDPVGEPTASLGDGTGFDAAVGMASALVAEAMGTGRDGAAEAAAEHLARVERGDLGALAGVRPVDRATAGAVLAGFGSAGRSLVEAGVLAHLEQVWCLSVEAVRRLLADPVPGDWHRHRHRNLRWQALLQQVIAVHGRAMVGDGVSPGRAAGPARRLSASRDLRRVVPGDIVVLRRPSPQLAPSLWVASGLVAERGSGAAHLVEVARSLRVPAVVGIGPIEVAEGDDLLFVDGDEARVAALADGRRHQEAHGSSTRRAGSRP
ncbi:MAG: PEP-utilizing enzyme [Acidimicrobiales bacterium]